VTTSYAHRRATSNTPTVVDSSRLRIQAADPGKDLEVLAENLGQRVFFADRLSRQQSDNGVLLVAWWDDQPIGDAYLWLEEAEEPEIREYLPGVALLTHVEIQAPYRSRGIGTSMIACAERILVRRNHKQVALAVEISNVRAAKLYSRLDYHVCPHPLVPCYDPFDDSVKPPDMCHIMVKQLA
jgi:GNAT superfamily N-acetyltransferase